MKEQDKKMVLPKLDDLFTSQEQRDNPVVDEVKEIELYKIGEFPDHPFRVLDDDKMEEMVKSVKEYGVLLPVIVRKRGEGNYQMISGHRRKRACELAGIDKIKCIVKDLTDDEATILMVDSNIQREEILPSEKAFAYKLKLEAMKHQGKRVDLEENETSTPVVAKLRTDEILGNEVGESRENIRRYIRLTYLIPELLEQVDKKRIAFRPAVELSYLSEENQYVVENIFENRYKYTQELNKMGAKITAQGKTAIFEGVNELNGAPVYASDLRAGAALIVAGIVAKGTTEIYNLEYIDRGYENIEEKFRNLGAKIIRVNDDEKEEYTC